MRSEVSKWLIAGTLSSFLLGACQPDVPAPAANPEIDWEQYYSSKQVAKEHLPTADGGFVVVGTRYGANDEGDIVVIKTDQDGVKTWETFLSKADGSTLHYDERGVSILEKANSMGYVVVGNRNFVDYSGSTPGIRNTDIVMYDLDINGVATSTDGTELNASYTSNPNGGYYDFVASDAVFVDNGGITGYAVTGYTTQINNKPQDQFNNAYDKTDMYNILVDASFSPLWMRGNEAYGFQLSDVGGHIYAEGSNLVVSATIEKPTNPSSTVSPPVLHKEIATLIIDINNGTPISPNYEGGPSTDYTSGVTACVNTALNRLVQVTVDANSANSLSLFYKNTSTLQATGPASLVIPVAPPYAGAGGTITPTSINNTTGGGVLISFTHTNMMGSNLGIIRLNDAGTVQAGYPYYYGYGSSSTAFNGQSEQAASVTEINDGSIKYVYSGTFEANTANSKIGLVQLNKSTGL